MPISWPIILNKKFQQIQTLIVCYTGCNTEDTSDSAIVILRHNQNRLGPITVSLPWEKMRKMLVLWLSLWVAEVFLKNKPRNNKGKWLRKWLCNDIVIHEEEDRSDDLCDGGRRSLRWSLCEQGILEERTKNRKGKKSLKTIMYIYIENDVPLANQTNLFLFLLPT